MSPRFLLLLAFFLFCFSQQVLSDVELEDHRTHQVVKGPNRRLLPFVGNIRFNTAPAVFFPFTGRVAATKMYCLLRSYVFLTLRQSVLFATLLSTSESITQASSSVSSTSLLKSASREQEKVGGTCLLPGQQHLPPIYQNFGIPYQSTEPGTHGFCHYQSLQQPPHQLQKVYLRGPMKVNTGERSRQAFRNAERRPGNVFLGEEGVAAILLGGDGGCSKSSYPKQLQLCDATSSE
nr:snakin-2 [Ipomoea trifida]